MSSLLELLSWWILMPFTCFGCVAFTGSSFEVHSVLHPQLIERLCKHCESCSTAGYVLTVLNWKSAGVGSCKQSCVYKIRFLATPLNWEQIILTKQKQTGKRHGPERHSQPDLSNNCVYLLTQFYSINNYWSMTVLLGYWKYFQLQGKECILLTVLLAQQFILYLYWLWCERRKWKRM